MFWCFENNIVIVFSLCNKYETCQNKIKCNDWNTNDFEGQCCDHLLGDCYACCIRDRNINEENYVLDRFDIKV